MEKPIPDAFQLSCPLPLDQHDTVQMAHGGGGRFMRALIEGMFLPAFGTGQGGPGSRPTPPHDSALLETEGGRLAFTTDTFVVSPLFFPGGDIGKLAVYGTVNDLAMAGAKPAWLSAGFILEEGLPMATLRRIVESMRSSRHCRRANRTGDRRSWTAGKAMGSSSTRPNWVVPMA